MALGCPQPPAPRAKVQRRPPRLRPRQRRQQRAYLSVVPPPMPRYTPRPITRASCLNVTLITSAEINLWYLRQPTNSAVRRARRRQVALPSRGSQAIPVLVI